jgi:signal transduction histidine kinase
MRRDAQRNIELTELAAQLSTEREARAREAVGAERARIARELHDAVAHTVSVMTNPDRRCPATIGCRPRSRS